MKTCQTQDLCAEFLDAVARLVQDLRAKNLTQPTDAEGYCAMARNCGPVGWAVFHGAASAFREHVCESCGKDAESLMRAAHDLVNTKLGKPLHSRQDLDRWEKVMRQAELAAVAHHMAQPSAEFERWADAFSALSSLGRLDITLEKQIKKAKGVERDRLRQHQATLRQISGQVVELEGIFNNDLALKNRDARSGALKNSPAVRQDGPHSPVPTLGAHQGFPACRGAQVRKLERCIRQVKAKGQAANPWAVCQASIGCRQSRPPRQMQAQDHEVGYALCKTPDGRTVHGPEAHGDHDHVDIPLVCPPGSRPYGTFHTHPDGQAKPSDADMREGCRLGLKVLCVGDGQTTNCSRPRC